MQFLCSRLGRRNAELSNRTLLEGDTLELPGTQRTLVYERFAPTVDKQSGMPTADPRVNDPAVLLGASEAETRSATRSSRSALRRPAAAGASCRSDTCSTAGFSTATIRACRSWESGPSCLLAGLVISFYSFRRASTFASTRSGRASRGGAAATTVKGYDVFESEFDRLMRSVEGGRVNEEDATR